MFLAAATTLAACQGDTQAVTDAEGQGLVANPRRPVQLMLRERAKRLLAGDVEGYLAALSPEARAFEEPIARVAVTLPLSKIDLTVGEATISDDGSSFRNASVTMQYSFKELPADNPFRLRFLYDIERRQEGWVVTKSQFILPPDAPPPPPLWPFGPVEITRSPHFLVMARPGVSSVAEITDQAEKAYAELRPRLTLTPDDRLLLVLATDRKEYMDNYGDEGSVALARHPFIVTAGHPARPEERLAMANLQALSEVGEVKLEQSLRPVQPDEVFRHELAHLALSRFTRPCTNGWVAEGGAMLLAEEHAVRSAEWRAIVAADELAGLRLNPNEPPLDYAFAYAAALYLVEKGGSEKFFDFYQNFKNLPEPTLLCSGQVGTVRSRLDERLLRRYYRIGVEDLEGFTREYIRKAAPAP